MTKEKITHASNGFGGLLCGPQRLQREGRITRPGESVNCPDCRVALNHVRRTYPEHADYTDWRPTKAELQRAARDMVADMHGGADD